MRRRDFIMVFGLLGLGAVTLWRSFASFWRSGFNEHTARTVTAVVDVMFPGDELPGAIDLGIHRRLLALSDYHPMMADGVDWLDRRAASQGALDFLALDTDARSAALDAAFSSEDDDVQQFVVAMRYFGTLNYYSEPAIKAAFAYTGPPQPEGFPDFQDPPK